METENRLKGLFPKPFLEGLTTEEMLHFPFSYTFDDVVLDPVRSQARSRRDSRMDVSTQLTNLLRLPFGVMSSYMDTVTEYPMSLGMALCGGVGINHRWGTLEQRVEWVRRTKRAGDFKLEEPYTLAPSTLYPEIKEAIRKYGVTSFLVVDEMNHFLGIISERDLLAERLAHIIKARKGEAIESILTAKDIMTPANKVKTLPPDASIEEAIEHFRRYKYEKIPLVNRERRVCGLITIKAIQRSMRKYASKDEEGRFLVASSVGIKPGYLEEVEALLEAGSDLIVVNVAHGHLELCLEAVANIRRKFPDCNLFAGDIATYAGYRDLRLQGADGVLVGIGPGSICKTREVTGIGVPQLTAIMRAAHGKKEFGGTVIADGGIRNSADLVKAFAAGADAVILGSMLAGTEESPGTFEQIDGQLVKLHRGMGSHEAEYKMRTIENLEIPIEPLLGDISKVLEFDAEEEQILPPSEGVEVAYVPYRGKVKRIVNALRGALMVAFSYCGAMNIKELQQNARWNIQTGAGRKEGSPHSLLKIAR